MFISEKKLCKTLKGLMEEEMKMYNIYLDKSIKNKKQDDIIMEEINMKNSDECFAKYMALKELGVRLGLKGFGS